MLNPKPLKNKIMQYEQDYIEAHIKWHLKLGDDIFKKIDIKKAVLWLRLEINKKSNNQKNISLNELNSLLNEAFSDVRKKSKNKKNLKEKIDFKETELFKIFSGILEKPRMPCEHGAQ